MIRGTTPTFILTVKTKSGNPVDLSIANNVYVTISQGSTEITLSGDQLNIATNVIECFLPQEESLNLIDRAKAKIQVNWTYTDADGQTIKRGAARVKEITIDEQLLKRVIE